jgi:hypothetical protein
VASIQLKEGKAAGVYQGVGYCSPGQQIGVTQEVLAAAVASGDFEVVPKGGRPPATSAMRPSAPPSLKRTKDKEE